MLDMLNSGTKTIDTKEQPAIMDLITEKGFENSLKKWTEY